MKRYIAEKGSESIARIYERSEVKEIVICFSIWNIGESIGVIDYYQRRGWISRDQSDRALSSLAGEALRLLRIESLEVLPVSSSVLSESWDLVRKHHIYQADALQIASCKRSEIGTLVSADKGLLGAAKEEGLTSVDIENAQQVDDETRTG